jgi:hypothetical protein
MTHYNSKQTPAGFALLITLLVVSVVVAVTLSIVELSLKQLALSVDSKDSEIAFHAANAGLECARYLRRTASSTFEVGNPVTFNCFGQTIQVASGAVTPGAEGVEKVTPAADAKAFVYRVDLEWGTALAIRCSAITLLTIVVEEEAPAFVTLGSLANPLKNMFPTYPSDTKTCEPGGRCTTAAVTGYSAPCASKNTPGTLKREILLEF